TFAGSILNNRGRLGALRGYTVGDFKELTQAVRGHVSGYSPLEITSMKLGTRYAQISSEAALENYAAVNDKLNFGSHVTFRTPDRSLEGTLYVGKPEDLQEVGKLVGEDELFWHTMKKLGKTYGKDAAIILGTSLVGGFLGAVGKAGKIAKAIHFTGRAVRTGGLLYGAGDMARNFYGEFIPTGVATLTLVPNSSTDFTADQVNNYRTLIDKLGEYQKMGPQEKK
ncbi:MAG: hypothetical protein AABY26_04300, partial [Nanoarchaeota archaeon]